MDYERPTGPLTTSGKLSAQSQALLDRFAEVDVVPYHQQSVLVARETMEQSVRLQQPPRPVASIDDVLADGRLPVRLYRPSLDPGLPLVVYLHGGGWVGGTIALADEPCRALATATGAVVASVGYRLAPETKHPDSLWDCYAAIAWMSGAAGRLGVDPDAVILCGDSAGGNLAAAVTLAARRRGDLSLCGQVLLYPLLAPPESAQFASRSRLATGYGLTASDISWFWEHYLPASGEIDSALAAPSTATDLSDLPPGLVITAEFDPLHDEGVDYARRLRAAGVDMQHHNVPGAIHGFFWMSGRLDAATEILPIIAARVAQLTSRQHLS